MLPYLLDGFLLAFLFWFALTGMRNGFLGMLGRLLASFVALAAAWLLAAPVRAYLETHPLYLHLQSSLAGSILKLFSRSTRTLPQAIAASGLPPQLQRGLAERVSGADAGDSLATGLASGLAAQILDAIVFMALFLLILMILRLVLGFLSQLVNSLPVIGPLNRFAGLFAGVAYALVIVLVLLLLVALAAPWLPRAVEAIDGTSLLRYLYLGNPLLSAF